MLTIEINHSRLEQTIEEKARLNGKSKQEVVQDLLLKAIPEVQEGLFYKMLSAEENGYEIDFKIEEEITSEEAGYLFSHVGDSEKFTADLRKRAWRKK